MNVGKKQLGFTIVELLIVIVVIAILASITIVAYNGIQNRAHDASVQNDLRQLGQKVAQYRIDNSDTFPTVDLAGMGSLGVDVSRNSFGNHYVTSGNSYNLLYCFNSSTGLYAFIASSQSGKIFVFREGGVSEVSGSMSGSATMCPNYGGVSSPTVYWYYGHGGTNVWVSWA